MLHRHAEHDQRPAIEDQADADEQADHPQSRHRPSLPNHDPKSKGDEPVKNRPSPVWSTNTYCRDDSKETLEDQEKGDQQRQDDGGGPRIGEDQESPHDVQNTGHQIEEKAAPAPFLRPGMDSARGTGKDHQPAKNSHREDRHEESLTDRDPSHEYEEDSEEQKPPPVILDLIQSGQRDYVSVHLLGLLMKCESPNYQSVFAGARLTWLYDADTDRRLALRGRPPDTGVVRRYALSLAAKASSFASNARQIRNTLEAKLGFPPDTFKSLGSESGGSFLQILSTARCCCVGCNDPAPMSSAIPARFTTHGAV